MTEVTIYVSGMCPFCYRAKALLDTKGVAYNEIDVTFDPAGRQDMIARAGGATSVPQIWIGDEHVGGSDELYELEARGELDERLGVAA